MTERRERPPPFIQTGNGANALVFIHGFVDVGGVISLMPKRHSQLKEYGIGASEGSTAAMYSGTGFLARRSTESPPVARCS
jgi:hypothetical protein